MADPAQVVKTRKPNHERVFTWFAGRWRNHQPKRAKRPHSKFSEREPLDGPATRPNELHWPWRIASGSRQPNSQQAPNAGMGKRAWRTPTPTLAPVRSQDRAGALSFFIRLLRFRFFEVLMGIRQLGTSKFKAQSSNEAPSSKSQTSRLAPKSGIIWGFGLGS